MAIIHANCSFNYLVPGDRAPLAQKTKSKRFIKGMINRDAVFGLKYVELPGLIHQLMCCFLNKLEKNQKL